jgi:hypothetical protein
MSRSVARISEAYKEYVYGLFPNPSVKSLETTYQNKWRIGNTESKFYGYRLPLLDIFDELITKGVYEKEIFLPRLEVLREKMGSIRKLCDKAKPLLFARKEKAKRVTSETSVTSGTSETSETDLLLFLERKIVG